MSVKYFSDNQHIYYPNTNIAINKFNIQDSDELFEMETQILEKNYIHFHSKLNDETIFDEAYLKTLHKHNFEKLYTWSGHFRSINIAKGNSVFCQVKFLNQESKRIFSELNKDNYLKNYNNKPKEEFAERLAYYTCELIALHPFNELNGRITRLFFDMIAVFNGYKYIDYKNIATDKKDNAYIQASIACMNSDYKFMQQIIFEGLDKV